MSAWLYQMTTNAEEPWNASEYRYVVWEGKDVTWPAGKIYPRGQGKITIGDIVVFFFSKTRTDDPGIYGWGIVTNSVQRKAQTRITFQVAPPSDYLKMTPCWNKELGKLLDEIRKPVKQGTLWGLTMRELQEIRDHVREHFD